MGQVTESTQSTKDCILRQAAIDAARDALKRVPTAAIRVMDAIQKLPSVQKIQLPKEGTTSDCISRREAIDALTEYGNGRVVYIGVKEAVGRIEQLPSAQPEGKTYEDGWREGREALRREIWEDGRDRLD